MLHGVTAQHCCVTFCKFLSFPTTGVCLNPVGLTVFLDKLDGWQMGLPHVMYPASVLNRSRATWCNNFCQARVQTQDINSIQKPKASSTQTVESCFRSIWLKSQRRCSKSTPHERQEAVSILPLWHCIGNGTCISRCSQNRGPWMLSRILLKVGSMYFDCWYWNHLKSSDIWLMPRPRPSWCDGEWRSQSSLWRLAKSDPTRVLVKKSKCQSHKMIDIWCIKLASWIYQKLHRNLPNVEISWNFFLSLGTPIAIRGSGFGTRRCDLLPLQHGLTVPVFSDNIAVRDPVRSWPRNTSEAHTNLYNRCWLRHPCDKLHTLGPCGDAMLPFFLEAHDEYLYSIYIRTNTCFPHCQAGAKRLTVLP